MRILHTMIRVLDLERSISFYRDILGFEVRRRDDHEKGRFTLVFLGAPGDDAEIELTYNWDQKEPYVLGHGFGHIALNVDSLDDLGMKLDQHGLKFSWGPGKTPSGTGAMAFVDDPDGYEIELLS